MRPKIQIHFIDPLDDNFADALVFICAASMESACELCPELQHIVTQLQGFKFKKGSYIVAIDSERNNRFVILGAQDQLCHQDFVKYGNIINSEVDKSKCTSIFIYASKEIDMPYLIYRASVAGWQFTKYKSDINEKDRNTSKILNCIGKQNESPYRELFAPVFNNVIFAKDLIVETGTAINPSEFCNKVKLHAGNSKIDIKIKIINAKELKKMGAGGILGVAAGSSVEPAFLVLEYKGGNKDDKWIGLAGKGVTFDTGGLSLKPSRAMETMKCDMAGAAAVVGGIMSVASAGIKKNVVAVAGLVENSISNTATKPGDVLHMLNGKTVEVINTDAEGRLVLADVLTYIQENYDVDALVDIATLTGAVNIALGDFYAGLFSQDKQLVNQIIDAGNQSHERVWHLPVSKAFLESWHANTIADVMNSSFNTLGAQPSRAAAFLQYFIRERVRWAHIDFSSMTWEKGKITTVPSAYGVGLLYNFVMRLKL